MVEMALVLVRVQPVQLDLRDLLVRRAEMAEMAEMALVLVRARLVKPVQLVVLVLRAEMVRARLVLRARMEQQGHR